MKSTPRRRAKALPKTNPDAPSLPTLDVQEKVLSEAKLQKQVESEFKRHKERLEVLVQERTAELSSVNAGLRAANETLNRFNRAAVDRELRMVQLKKQVNELSRELGRPPPYALDFAKGARGSEG